MAEKLSEQQVEDLIAILRKDVSVDVKVQHVTAVKSSIKQHNVPDPCVAPVFEALRLASSSQHAVLVNAGFTSLNHLLTRLSRQEPKYISKEAKYTLPLVVDKMGDQKDKLRSLAIQAMVTIHTAAPIDAERFVRNTAMAGKNPRAKETGMQWLVQMHKDHGLPFRAYVPTLMELLEDADGMVRDNAKMTVIELFRDAPNGAKSDLKKQLKNFKVRPAIESAIVKELVPGPATRVPAEEVRPDIAPVARPNLAASVSSLSTERPVTPMPEVKADSVEPSYVNTQRELDDIFRDMHPWFEGRESEQNWLKREESVIKLRRLIAGNAADFPDAFITGCRVLLDGIIKAVSSLRTSLSKEGCGLVQDLANTFGPGIDPMVELLLQACVKLCAATKKIASQLANTTVDTIMGRTTYNARIMQHVWIACQDKNVQPRTYASGWLITLLKKEAHHKSHLEHNGGLEVVEKCIKKGLNDANPGVRERMRAAYWVYAGIWPARAEAIMDGLDATAQKLLQKDPNNPNSPKRGAEPVAAARPGLGFSKSTTGGPPKPSLREAMLAQKKAALASKTRNLPARPGSAMATITPSRSVSNMSSSNHSTASSSHTAPAAPAAPATRPRAEPSTMSHGGMSVAPMRPARRRPEMPRPATAGPYSGRNRDGLESERSSPGDPKSKAVTPKTISGSPKRTVTRTRPGHQPTHSESSLPTPSKAAAAKAATVASPRAAAFASPRAAAASPRVAAVASPRASPAKAKSSTNGFNSSSPSKADEEFTLLVPNMTNLTENARSSPPKISLAPLLPSPMLDEPVTTDELAVDAPSLKVYEDPFTEDQEAKPRSTSNGSPERPVLEDKPVNEDAANLSIVSVDANSTSNSHTPDKSRQNIRLLESGMTRVKSQNLDVHGFRKLQSLIRDNKVPFTDEKFDALISGLFEYLESPLSNLAPEKIQDVKAQILATIKLLLRKVRGSFQPHVSKGLESLLGTRAGYDARTHIVSGLELLADELVTIGDADEITVTMTRRLSSMDTDAKGCRSLSMGLHVLKQLIDTRTTFVPNEAEIHDLAALASRCLESKESGVRMDAVQLCVALHSRLGENTFWESMKSVKDDPKSLITYYVVKRQREGQAAA
ncbi:STU1 protein [Pseudomassariella vexata]|uniref:STU1 protein n=1 Tax=Pseudomassariella vexata TaxID=1141098 RepID=A0A1Y2DUR9_9PEZI|nr:STU1 protein [Pseudomassariella vexata]ORY62939.1 STU1 protein [Pseudomassariella vexata]